MSIDARFNENKQHSGGYYNPESPSDGGEDALVDKSVTLLHKKRRSLSSVLGIILHLMPKLGWAWPSEDVPSKRHSGVYPPEWGRLKTHPPKKWGSRGQFHFGTRTDLGFFPFRIILVVR